MALSKKGRAALPKGDFAGPGRSFPVENKAHAEAALMDVKAAQAKHTITPGEAAEIRREAKHKLKGY